MSKVLLCKVQICVMHGVLAAPSLQCAVPTRSAIDLKGGGAPTATLRDPTQVFHQLCQSPILKIEQPFFVVGLSYDADG